MNSQESLPVRYVLYSHYPEDKDFEIHRNENKKTHQLPGVQALVSHFKNLTGLLNWPGYEGLLVLFYAPGLSNCLEGIANRKSETELVQSTEKLRFARAVETYLLELVKKDYVELSRRFRFVTALDLYRVFRRINNSEIAGNLQAWIVGEDPEALRYDSPKIIEAIVRLRLLGSGIPVFRVDHDVLFRRVENQDKKNLEFSSTIGSCLAAYELRRDSPSPSFIFSASYDYRAVFDSILSNKIDTWNRAFATRIFPALLARQDLIDETLKKINDGCSQKDAWADYASESFSANLARTFLGLNEDLRSSGKGIGEVGADPMSSVISGAMLYLSDGAILDLPPFSNFRLNVSWIDDHLKYCLHRELRHLTPPKLKMAAKERSTNPLLSHAKLDNVLVQKTGRKIETDLRKYILDIYLPTLLLGTIMDAWITPDPILKRRIEDLPSEGEKALNEIRQKGQSDAVLACALQKALEECSFERNQAGPLKRKLREVALKRINLVRRQWIDLTEDGQETFASIWAKGKARESFPNLRLKYVGIADPNRVPVNDDVAEVSLLDGSLIGDLGNLVDDATQYIKWTLNWPTVVQVVRSVEQGTLRTDLNFDPEHEYRSASAT